MMGKTIILIVIFYFLALLQVSFLGFFYIFGINPNLLFLGFISVNIFFKDSYSGLLSALLGGFFWDVFSSQIFGFHVLMLLGIAAFTHLILKKYVRFPL